jgi:hypothetical protein
MKPKKKKLVAQNVPVEISMTPDRLNRSGQVKSKYRITEGGMSGQGRIPVFTVEKTKNAARMATFGGERKGKGATIKRRGK